MASLSLVFSFDGLAISPLGPYGSSWVETPSLDRLAAGGSVYDRCIVPSDDPHHVLQEIWDAPRQPPHDSTNWIDAIRQQGIRPLLITDCLAAAELPQAQRFDDISLLDAAEPADRSLNPQRTGHPCEEIEETACSRLVTTFLEEWTALGEDEPACLWVHSDFLTRLWDAPHELLPAEDLIDEPEEVEENADGVPLDLLEADGQPKVIVPRPPKIFHTDQPPRFCFAAEHDPDITLAWMNNYAAQIRLIDALMGLVLQVTASREQTTMAVLGTSGFSLGEHGAIGHQIGPLRSPSIQVPLIIHGPGIPVSRSQHVCSPCGLGSLLSGGESEDASELRRMLEPRAWKQKPDEFAPCIVTRSRQPRLEASFPTETSASDQRATSEGEAGSTTATCWTSAAWMCVREGSDPEEEHVSLYFKPDDRCDINNVADRLPEVVEKIQAAAHGPEA